MLKIRLRRVGAKKQPSYRLVVAESTAPRNGRFVEIIGHHNPRTEPETISVNKERAAYWLSQGAQPTPAAERILRKEGVYDMKSGVVAKATETVKDAAGTVAHAATDAAGAVASAASAAAAAAGAAAASVVERVTGDDDDDTDADATAEDADTTATAEDNEDEG